MKKNTLPSLFLVLTSLFALGFASLVSAQTEKIVNGGFESMPALTGWQTNKLGGDGTISSTRDTSNPISGAASARIDIGGSDDPNAGEWWHLNFTQEFQLETGRFYNATFKIRASEPVMVQATIAQTAYPFTAVSWTNFMVGTEVQTVRMSGVSGHTGTGAIRFLFGKTKRNTEIWIDDVSVMETEASGTTATVTVDFNAAETAADLTGLLSGMGNWYGTDSSQPGQQFIDPLRLKHWRVHQSPNFEFIDRAIASGAMPIVIRSLNWWADSTPGNTNTPWADDWAALDAEFDALATRYGTDIIYEIWNEPDLPESFPNYEGGTFEKYLEMFERMHNRIRAIEPDAYIIGPSLSEAFDWYRLHQFMQFCADNNLTVQGMSLHMWDGDPALEDMRDDLLRVRSEIMENPKYASVGMNELFVTEYAYDEMRMRPGSNLAMVRFMEEGLVDGATTSCWTHLRDCTSNSSCFDGTLAGMLTCGGTAPRPLWWAKKWYADSVGGRVEANSSHGGIVPIASNHSGRGQVILASRGYNGAAQDMTSVTVNLNNLVAGGVVASDGTHDVWIYRAPFEDMDVAHDALWDPELIASTTVSVSGGNASLTLNNEVNAYDAILIVFEEPAPVDFRPFGTWTGDSNNDLNTALNWTGEAVPASGTIATWSGEQAGPQTLTLAAAVGGADGWKLDFTADQVDHLAIENAAATSQNLRLRTGGGNVQGNSLDIASGAGAVTIGGGDNPLQVVLGPSDATTSTAEIRNNSANKLTFAANANLIRGGTGARNLWIRGSGDVDILGNITLTGSGNLSMWGSGTLRLEGANSAASIFRAAGNGTVVFTQAEAINSFTEFRIGFTNASGTLRYEGAEDATLTRQVRIGEGADNTGSATIDASGTGTLSFSNAAFNVLSEANTTASRTLTLTGSNTGNNTIAGNIQKLNGSGVLSLVKNGAGTWILNGANHTFDGPTIVNEGTLIINGSLAAASHVTLADGAVLGGNGTINGNLTLADGAGAAFSTDSTLTVNGNVDLGNLSIAQVTGLDSSTPGGTYQLFGGSGTFDTSGITNVGEANKVSLGDDVYAWFEISNGLQLVVDAPGAPVVVPTGTWSGQGEGNDLNTAANWGGNAVPGSGATATWSGFQLGSLNLTFGAAVGGAAGWKFNFTSEQVGNLTFSNTAAASRNLRINAANDALIMAAGAGGVQIGTLTGTANPIQVVFGQSGGSFQLNNNSSNELVFGSNVSIASGGANSHDVAFYGSGVTRILGTYSSNTANAGGFIRVRNGRLILNGDNQHTGSIMADSGITEFTSTAAIGTGDAASFIRIGQANLSGTLRYSGAGDAVVNREISLGNGANAAHTGNATIESTGLGKVVFTNATFNLDATQNVSVTRTLTLAGTSTADNEIQGIIANNAGGAGVVAITKNGSGRWILSGANTYSGDTTVSEGHLRLAHANALGNSALEIRGGVTEIADGITAVPGTGKIAFVRNTSDLKSLTVQATGSASAIFNGDVRIIDTENRFSLHAGPGDTLTIGGNLHSNAAATQRFTKTGEGTVILSGADTAALRLQGENIVAAGRLLLNGNMTNATGSFTVQDGAFIGGNGIWGGALTLASGGGLAFDSGATLTVNGTANLGTLRVANISGLDATTPDGSYPLLTAGTLGSTSLQNLGPENATTFGNQSAWFEVSGNTLNLHVATVFTFTVDNGEATITAYNGPGGLVRIPDELDGNPVVAIGAGAFENNTSITRLILPDGISQLGDSAFAGGSAVQWILFRGDAPSLGSDVFGGISADVYYRKSTSGWDEQAGFGGLAIQRWDIAMNRVLGRGINFGNSFDAHCETCWGNPWQPEYFETIGAEAFDHIRLPVRWEPSDRSMNEAPFTIFPVFFERIKEVVDKALAEGLPVVLNMHHHDELFYTEDPADFAVQRARFIAQWAQIAEFFDDYPEDLLFFELLNEPHDNVTPAIWNEMIGEGLAEVRAVNPDRMVLIGTALRGGFNGLAHLVLPADDALILTPHYYEPFTFTHQSSHVANSAAWAGTEWRDSDIERQAVLDDLAVVTAFAEANDIPVYLGEFGVIQDADFDSRVRYLRFLTRTFESLDMSWAVWQFTSGFTVTDETTKEFIPELLDALLHDELPEANVAQLSPVYTSNFSSDVDSWTRNVHQGAAASLSGGSGALTLDITNGGSAIWHVQLRRAGINLQQGRTYRVTLTGSSAEGLTASTTVAENVGSFNPYSGISMLRFPPEGITHTFFFRMNNASDSNARINLDIGLAAGTLVLSEVRIEEYDVLFRPVITTQPTASTLSEGQSLGDASLDGGAADVGGLFSFSDPSIVPPLGTSQQEVTFTPTDTSTHTTTTFFIEVTVESAFANWIDDFFPGETDPAIVGPEADPDGDGLTNEQEWLWGTDPSDPASRYVLEQEVGTMSGGGDAFILRFPTLPGRVYTVERSTTLQSGSWTQIGDPILGDGDVATVEDPLLDRAFFRVQVEWAD